MPPRFRFTKEQIIEAAVNIVREGGMDALTARSLAARLNSSAKPIFGLFQNMEEVQSEVMQYANQLYHSFLEHGAVDQRFPSYKAIGIAYIQFAKEEKELFKLLFMRDRTGEKMEDNREEIRPILDALMKSLNISEEEAFLLHMETWIYVHGIATMSATSYLDWDLEFISKSLTDVYLGLTHRFAGGK